MNKILITGASGMIGSRLTGMLLEKGYDVVHLSRSEKKGRIKTFTWDVKGNRIQDGAFDGVDTVIHLAGENVGEKRWSEKRKREILESRTQSTRLLGDYLKSNAHTVSNFISASAIGYYGFDDDQKIFTEDDAPGRDFLAEVVQKWEHEVDKIAGPGIRIVKVRVGIVLSKDGGALKEMAKPIRNYIGAPLGSGNQKMSWIHIDDVCRVFVEAAGDHSISGAVNAVGPAPVTNRDLTKAIAHKLHKSIWMPPVPGFVLKLVLGEMSDIVLKGSSVSNKKLVASGFQYRFPTLTEALDDLLT